MSALRLTLVRHAQTANNAARIMDTVIPGAPLDDVGRAQAADLAAHLDGEDVVAVYASTAIRTQETAAPLAARRGLTVTVVGGLREVDVGALEGATGDGPYAAYDRAFASWAAGDRALRLPGGESAEDVLQRFLPAVDQIRARHDSGVVVVVSHGGVIRIAALGLTDNVTAAMAIDGALPNTGQVVFEWTAGPGAASAGWRCVQWDGVTVDVH